MAKNNLDKKEDKDKTLLFGANYAKITNCVLASAAAQHVEAIIKLKQYSYG